MMIAQSMMNPYALMMMVILVVHHKRNDTHYARLSMILLLLGRMPEMFKGAFILSILFNLIYSIFNSENYSLNYFLT